MGNLWTYGTISSPPTDADLVPVYHGSQTKDTPVSNLLKDRVALQTVSTSGASSDNVCDGTADEVQVNAAITAVNATGGGDVMLREGTYYVDATISPKSYVRLIGAGIGKTIIRFGASATASNFITSGASTLFNFEVVGITFDAEDKVNAGIINCSTIVQSMIVHDCEFLNMNCTSSSHWPLRFGKIDDADVDGSASFNCQVYNNRFYNNNCDTFEVILLPNVRDSFFHHNKFDTNSTTGTREVSFYSDNVNCRYENNIHINWSDGAVHCSNCDQVDIIGNTFTNTADTSATALDVRNTINSKIQGNNITLLAGTGDGLDLRDDNIGRDGHALRNANSYNLDISGNTFTNTFYGISNFSGSSVNLAYHHITIENNEFYNCLKAPIRFGPNTTGVTMDIEYIFIKNNKIYSWSGNIEGAIGFYGDSTAPTNIKNLYIEDNYIADNTTGGTSGAIRLSAAQAQTIKQNYMIVTTGSYGALSLPNSGTVVLCSDNPGLNPIHLFAQGNVTGATSFSRANGDVITATATGAVTTTIPAGQPGDTLTLIITQDGFGGHAVSKPSNVKLVGGTFSPSAGAGAIDSWTLKGDGTNWYEISRALNVS